MTNDNDLARDVANKMAEKFFDYVILPFDGSTTCWQWTGQKRGKTTYGVLNHESFRVAAHRLSWFIATGEMPPSNLFVCHKCDHPWCVNPEHLFIGTHKDNMRDMYLKRRHWKFHKTHCPSGHRIGGDNVKLKKKYGRTYEVCLICWRKQSDDRNNTRRKTAAAPSSQPSAPRRGGWGDDLPLSDL